MVNLVLTRYGLCNDYTMRKIADKKELMKLCSFIVMSDGGVYTKANGKTFSFIMNMKKENEDFVLYCKDIIDNITSCNIVDRKYYNTDGYSRKEQVRLFSKVHPYFKILRDRIYIGKYKSIDPHALKLLDWECMAILYMCDGALGRYLRPEIGMKNESYNVTLNLKRLSYGDQLLLKRKIKDNLGVEFNINRHNKYYFLRLRMKDVQTFMDNIRPYILPSFMYKIVDGLGSQREHEIV